jgi:hypothetical protein
MLDALSFLSLILLLQLRVAQEKLAALCADYDALQKHDKVLHLGGPSHRRLDLFGFTGSHPAAATLR